MSYLDIPALGKSSSAQSIQRFFDLPRDRLLFGSNLNTCFTVLLSDIRRVCPVHFIRIVLILLLSWIIFFSLISLLDSVQQANFCMPAVGYAGFFEDLATKNCGYIYSYSLWFCLMVSRGKTWSTEDSLLNHFEIARTIYWQARGPSCRLTNCQGAESSSWSYADNNRFITVLWHVTYTCDRKRKDTDSVTRWVKSCGSTCRTVETKLSDRQRDVSWTPQTCTSHMSSTESGYHSISLFLSGNKARRNYTKEHI